MLFNTVDFFVFFGIVYALYIIWDKRGQNRLLLFASYLFYGWWDARFLMLILVRTIIDYAAALAVAGERLPAKRLVAGSLLVLLGTGAFVGFDWVSIQKGSNKDLLSFLFSFDLTRQGLVSIACGVFSVVFPLIYVALWRITNEDVRRKAFVSASVIANIGILGFFKYFNFFVGSFAHVLLDLGMSVDFRYLDVILPVGISFYTFQTMSYTIDVYRRHLAPAKSFPDFALYVSFFPQLVAGPIERGTRLLPQILSQREITPEQFREGAFLVVWGLFKKVMIADSCATIVNEVFGNHTAYGGLEQLVAIYAFAWQIYADFSGYSDIARGLAKLMGFELMLNFNLPYFATNPSDFWRRWHISLSTWLRDYLYIPLGGSRMGGARTYRNLMITMVLGGLWHGAKWTMGLWGFYQGLILVVYRWFAGNRRRERGKNGENLSWVEIGKVILFFHITCFGWLIFRADNVAQVRDFIWTIISDFTLTQVGLDLLIKFSLLLLPLLCVQLIQARRADLLAVLNFSPSWRLAGVMSCVGCALLYWVLYGASFSGGHDFIYFQF